MSRSEFILEEDTYMVQYTEEVAAYCDPFCCGDEELDSFFEEQVFFMKKELLCKSYCWINRNNDKEIIAIATFSYDSIKSYTLDNSSRNALQRKIPHRKV